MPPFRFNFGVSKQDAEGDEQHAVVKAQARLFNPRPTNEVGSRRTNMNMYRALNLSVLLLPLFDFR